MRRQNNVAKASPGKLSYGSTGIGGVTHLAGEMLKSAAGIELIHVPYKGAGPQLVDVMGGNVAVGFTSLTATIPHVRSGRLKLLMVTSKRRSSAAPDTPTVAEVGDRNMQRLVRDPRASPDAENHHLAAQFRDRAHYPAARHAGALRQPGSGSRQVDTGGIRGTDQIRSRSVEEDHQQARIRAG